MKHLIIGGSIAGISAASAIRSSSPDEEITVVSQEKGKAYYRPLIPFLIEDKKKDIFFEEDPSVKYSYKHITGRATGIDVKSRKVLLSSGDKLGYDRLLMATGSSPDLPEIEGSEGAGIFTLRTSADAAEIREYAQGKKNAVILGGGLVGIKAALALNHLGIRVTLIEKLHQVLFGRLDLYGSQLISRALEGEGIHIVTGETIESIERKKDSVKAVKLSSGNTVKADFVIIATGVKPNIDILVDTGIKINEGIVVNEKLQSSNPDIFAAGDTVEFIDIPTGEPAVSALWTNAAEMGRFAGKNMAGGELDYNGFLSVMNAAQICDIPFISLGIIDPVDKKNYEIIATKSSEGYRKLLFRNDLLVGAVFIHSIEGAGIYTSLIKNRIPLEGLKEKAIDGYLSYADFIGAGIEEPVVA